MFKIVITNPNQVELKISKLKMATQSAVVEKRRNMSENTPTDRRNYVTTHSDRLFHNKGWLSRREIFLGLVVKGEGL